MAEKLPVETKIKNARGFLEKWKGEIAKVIPKFMDVETMNRVAMTSIRLNPTLADCTLPSLLACILESCRWGLYPDGVTGEAHLVPFNDKKRGVKIAQLIPGYRGLMKLARNSGLIRHIEARLVYEGDKFAYQYGVHPELIHVPCGNNKLDELVYAYAIGWPMDGGQPLFEVMTRVELDRARACSAAERAGADGPWRKFPEPMYRKTPVRALFKFLPSSPQMQRVITMDELADAGEQRLDMKDVEIEIEDAGPETSKPALDKLTDKLETGGAGDQVSSRAARKAGGRHPQKASGEQQVSPEATADSTGSPEAKGESEAGADGTADASTLRSKATAEDGSPASAKAPSDKPDAPAKKEQKSSGAGEPSARREPQGRATKQTKEDLFENADKSEPTVEERAKFLLKPIVDVLAAIKTDEIRKRAFYEITKVEVADGGYTGLTTYNEALAELIVGLEAGGSGEIVKEWLAKAKVLLEDDKEARKQAAGRKAEG